MLPGAFTTCSKGVSKTILRNGLFGILLLASGQWECQLDGQQRNLKPKNHGKPGPSQKQNCFFGWSADIWVGNPMQVCWREKDELCTKFTCHPLPFVALMNNFLHNQSMMLKPECLCPSIWMLLPGITTMVVWGDQPRNITSKYLKPFPNCSHHVYIYLDLPTGHQLRPLRA